jgi:two-component system phosphate regulon sensor histidine kinase PhoR
MLTTSRGISFLLALAICILVAASLSLLEETSDTILIVASGVSFSASYLLVYFTLEFLIFKEIRNIYSLLEKIQRKDLTAIVEKEKKGSISPLKKINKDINSYANARQKEIDTLEKNAEFRREFIADISHELKTPIFTIQGYIHTLLDGAINDKQVRKRFLKRAAKSLDSLDVLVQDLLTINQMESGVIKFMLIDFDLRELIEEVIEDLEYKATKKEITVVLDIKAGKTYLTNGDRHKIYRVFQNLIFNAMKYNHIGGEVTISLKTHKKSIQVEVKDDGKGIPPEDITRIFERFYRVDKSRSKEKGGNGLGLAIVKHILEGHQSKITVSSTLGKGSNFSFTLPYSRVDPAPEQITQSKS